jgi:hypothetical protein
MYGVKKYMFTYSYSMMLRRSVIVCLQSAYCVRLRKVNVIERELLRGMPSIRVVLNQCVEYNIVFNCIFLIFFIVYV